jgi:low molecular weight protein-tyrosine phosphatase
VTAPAPRDPFGKYRICLVCLGNICRSPMAEVVLRGELDRAGLSGRVEVDSAGTGDWHLGAPMDKRARAELARRGYDGAGHRARQFGPAWFADHDLIAAMDRANLRDVRAMAPDAQTAQQRVLLLRWFDPELAWLGEAGLGEAGLAADSDVPDPYYGGAADYAHVFELVQAAARGLAAQLGELLSDAAATE